jgi:hypothetical protein
MSAMPQRWNDDRLDDFRAETAQRFDTVEGELREQRVELVGFRGEVNNRFDGMSARLDELQRTMFRASYTLSAALIAGIIALVANSL